MSDLRDQILVVMRVAWVFLLPRKSRKHTNWVDSICFGPSIARRKVQSPHTNENEQALKQTADYQHRFKNDWVTVINWSLMFFLGLSCLKNSGSLS